MSIPARNGGFPEPLAGESQRLVRTRHAACGGETRVRLPGAVPAHAVRRVVCERCEAPYDVETAEELGVEKPKGGGATASAFHFTDSRLWRWGSAAAAAAAVVGVLLLVQGGSDEPAPSSVPPAPAGDLGAGPAEANFVSEPGFSLALPPGWEQVETEGGAAFAAASVDGSAEATLWIERDPELSFQEFEERTGEQLRSLSGSDPEVVERINAPTSDGTVVRLRADAPSESGVSAPYEVTLRATGPYRYYLATSVLPGASAHASDGADLIHGSFVPEAGGGGEIETGVAPGPGQDEGSELP
jgi:hypothetical protein